MKHPSKSALPSPPDIMEAAVKASRGSLVLGTIEEPLLTISFHQMQAHPHPTCSLGPLCALTVLVFMLCWTRFDVLGLSTQNNRELRC